MVEFYTNLHPLLQGILKGLAVIMVIFRLAARVRWLSARCPPGFRAGGSHRAMYPGGVDSFFGKFSSGRDFPCVGRWRQDALQKIAAGTREKFYFVLAPIVAMVAALTTVTSFHWRYLDAMGNVVQCPRQRRCRHARGFCRILAHVYSLILAGWASNSKYLSRRRAGVGPRSSPMSFDELSVVPVFFWVNAPDVSNLGRHAWSSSSGVCRFHRGELGRGLVYFPDADLGLHFHHGPLRGNEPPAVRHAGIRGDLVGGFHTEYGAFKWGLFFFFFYSAMLIGSAVFTLLFLGGWYPLPWIPLAQVVEWLGATNPILVGILAITIFLGKVLALIFFFMWVRWTVPRFRYDQVMELAGRAAPARHRQQPRVRDRDPIIQK